MSWKKFLYIYETDIVAPGIHFCLGDVKIETFSNERQFSIAANIQRVALLGKDTILSQSTILKSDSSHTTVLLTARTKEPNIFDARKKCVESLDSAVALMGNIYHPTIFDKRLYTGWDYSNPSNVIAETSVFLTDTVYQLDSVVINSTYEALGSGEDKFKKMSKLYAQAASMPISEEKFVKLWTILEIFPLETTPGQSMELSKLYELLKSIAGISQNKINKKLKIHSEIYDKYRSKIVHTGSIEFSEIELKDTTAKLDAVVRAVMRHLLGLDYNDELSGFL